jgi:hypothetical protein
MHLTAKSPAGCKIRSRIESTSSMKKVERCLSSADRGGRLLRYLIGCGADVIAVLVSFTLPNSGTKKNQNTRPIPHQAPHTSRLKYYYQPNLLHNSYKASRKTLCSFYVN